MPNQNKCNHVVGAFALLDSKTVYPVFQLDEEESPSNIDGLVKFYYCPDCGAKIDWKKIKEELLDDK